MSREDQLAEIPYGDLSEEGDPQFEAVEGGDLEEGDEDGDLDTGDVEEGDATSRRAWLRKWMNSSALAAMERRAAGRRLAAIGRQHGHQVQARLRAAAAVKKLARNDHVLFENIDGGKIINSTLGAKARLKHEMLAALKAALWQSVPFQPQVFPFTLVGLNYVLDLRTALNSVAGGNYNFQYTGLIITLQVSVLNTNVGAYCSVTRNLGTTSGPQSVVDTVELDTTKRCVRLLYINGLLIAGMPRLWMPTIAPSAVPDPTTQVVISGLPANYVPNARLLIPGDSEVDAFIRHLG